MDTYNHSLRTRSYKEKKRRSESLLEYSTEELGFASVARLKIEVNNDLASVIDHIITKNLESVAVVQNALFGKKKPKFLIKIMF